MDSKESLGLGCGLSNPLRFYHTRGHYPGAQLLCFHAEAVAKALRTFPQFDGLAGCYSSPNSGVGPLAEHF